HFHNPIFVIGDRPSCHVQDAAHFFHYFAFSQQLQHFALPIGEAFLLVDKFFMLPAQAVNGVTRHSLGQICLTQQHLTNRKHHLGCGTSLEQISGCSARESFCRDLSVGIHGEVDQLDTGKHFLHLPSSIQTIQHRHRDVEHNHVRLQFASSTDQGAPVADRSDYVEVPFEEPFAEFGHQVVVVCNQNAGTVDHFALSLT